MTDDIWMNAVARNFVTRYFAQETVIRGLDVNIVQVMFSRQLMKGFPILVQHPAERVFPVCFDYKWRKQDRSDIPLFVLGDHLLEVLLVNRKAHVSFLDVGTIEMTPNVVNADHDNDPVRVKRQYVVITAQKIDRTVAANTLVNDAEP